MKTILFLISLVISSTVFAQEKAKTDRYDDDNFCNAVEKVLKDEPHDYKNIIGHDNKQQPGVDPQEVMPGSMRLYDYENGDEEVAFLMGANNQFSGITDDYTNLKTHLKVCLGGKGYTLIEIAQPGKRERAVMEIRLKGEENPIGYLKILDNTDIMEISGLSHKYYCVLQFV